MGEDELAIGGDGPAAGDEDEDVVDGLTLLRKILLMLDTLGTLNLSQTPSFTSRSLISQANIPGSFDLSSRINRTTFGVVTLGLLPPIAPGKNEPVSLNLAKIFDTQPCETFNLRLMSHGLTPCLAISIIRNRM